MKPLHRVFLLLLAVFVVISQVNLYPHAAQRTVIVWAIGLGDGQEQIAEERRIAEKFNSSQDQIELKVNLYWSGGASAPDTFAQDIKRGEFSDVVGPVGFEIGNLFDGHWLDLQPLVDKTGYNLRQFPESVVNMLREPAGLMGIPFDVQPGLLYYNAELFDKAGLPYPPTKFGEKYILDGKALDWDYDTVAILAKRLTLDATGATPNDPKFDPAKIVQFGFVHQWDTIRSDFSTFGGARVADKNGKVALPESWRAEANWLWNGIWKEHFIPNNDDQATLTKDNYSFDWNAFASGKVAMARSMLWFTCCLRDMKSSWDIAVVPSYKGHIYAPADAVNFRIMKESKHPDAAFKVIQYLQGEAAADLLKIYAYNFPARPDLQPTFLKALAEKYPHVKNWKVVVPSLEYVVVPGVLSSYPNFRKGQYRFYDFYTLLYGESGNSIDINKEFDKLQADLQMLVDGDELPTATPKKK